MVVYVYNPRSWKVKAGGSEFKASLSHVETLSQNKNKSKIALKTNQNRKCRMSQEGGKELEMIK